MDVHDVLLVDQFPHEVLSLFGGEICGDDGYLRVMPVAFPIDAYCLEAGVGQSGCESCVPATYLDGARTLTSAFGFYL